MAQLSQHLGLDKPLWDQYWLFLVHLLQGDLGQSLTYQQPVVGLVFSAVPVTLSLVLYALVLSLIISVPLAAGPPPGPAVPVTWACAPTRCSDRACRNSGSASC